MTFVGNEKAPKSRRILLADDDDSIQRLVKQIAEKRGHQLIGASTDALTLVRALETQPDIIVLDMHFPDADGRDVLNKLKAEKKTGHIPVIVWSGRSGESDSRISLNLGAEDYMEKTDAQLMILKVERVLLRLDDTAVIL
jgi:CheY-like chemotaxis protein